MSWVWTIFLNFGLSSSKFSRDESVQGFTQLGSFIYSPSQNKHTILVLMCQTKGGWSKREGKRREIMVMKQDGKINIKTMGTILTWITKTWQFTVPILSTFWKLEWVENPVMKVTTNKIKQENRNSVNNKDLPYKCQTSMSFWQGTRPSCQTKLGYVEPRLSNLANEKQDRQ